MRSHCDPEVSVVIPTFNSEQFIKESIFSALSQIGVSLDVIVVDGGSIDRTIEIVESYQKSDSRVRLLINRDDFGPAHARKTAIEASNAEFIAFLDSDDLWSMNKLRTQIDWMNSRGWDFTYCYYGRLGHGKEYIFSALKYYNFRRNLFFRGIANFTVVIRRKLLTPDVLRFCPGYYAEDYLWWLLITKKGTSAYLVPIYGGSYRVHENARSVNIYKNLNSVNFYLKEIFEISLILRLIIFIFYTSDVLLRKILYVAKLFLKRARDL